jgi:hypothetical protein
MQPDSRGTDPYDTERPASLQRFRAQEGFTMSTANRTGILLSAITLFLLPPAFAAPSVVLHSV